MISIRPFKETDAAAAGVLIADTYRRFNLADFSAGKQEEMLGPFAHARSTDPEHRATIASVLQAEMVFVAMDGGELVGILRGRPDKLQSLFVRPDHHREGIGRLLVQAFEQECLQQGSTAVKLMSTLYAVPFYQAQGYKRSTGVRKMHSFEGEGLPYQPMKKILGAGED